MTISRIPAIKDARRWWALVALSVAVLAVGIDLTVLNVALPTLAGALHASTSQLQWFVDSYSLVLAALLLPAGLLADRFGRKRLLVIGLVIFGGGSAACAYVSSPVSLIAVRAVLGVGAAILTTVSLSILAVLFPTDAERQKATAVLMGCTMLGFPLGPVLGGWLLSHFWWGSVFLVNVPVVVVALGAIVWLMPESRSERRPRLDVLGVGLSSVGLVGVTYGVVQAGQDGWTSGPAVGALLAGGLLLAGFVGWERHLSARHREPLIDLGLFKSARFAWGTVLATMVSFAMFGLLFAMPQYFQAVRGLDPLGSGLRLLPLIGGLVVGAGLATRLQGGRKAASPRIAANAVVATGFALMSAGLLLGAGTTIDSGSGWAALWFVISGLGLGFALPAVMNAALGALAPERAGVGSGLIMACRQVGGTIGVALLGTVLNSVYRSHVDLHGLSAPAAHAVSEGVATGVALARRLGDPALLGSVQSAFVHALDVMLVVCAVTALVSMVLAALFLPHRHSSSPPDSAPLPARVEVRAGD